jgi:hypothetical protein
MSPVKTGRILDFQRYTLALRTRDVRGWRQACQTTCQAIFSVALHLAFALLPSRRVSERDPGKDVSPCDVLVRVGSSFGATLPRRPMLSTASSVGGSRLGCWS